jgi:DNA integrity scanning protein DisA with diadenylate cyclase activity
VSEAKIDPAECSHEKWYVRDIDHFGFGWCKTCESEVPIQNALNRIARAYQGIMKSQKGKTTKYVRKFSQMEKLVNSFDDRISKIEGILEEEGVL